MAHQVQQMAYVGERPASDGRNQLFSHCRVLHQTVVRWRRTERANRMAG